MHGIPMPYSGVFFLLSVPFLSPGDISFKVLFIFIRQMLK